MLVGGGRDVEMRHHDHDYLILVDGNGSQNAYSDWNGDVDGTRTCDDQDIENMLVQIYD